MRVRIPLILLAIMILLSGCGKTPDKGLPLISKTTITPSTLNIEVGASYRFTASMLLSDGATSTMEAHWSCSPSIGSISSSGLFTAATAGTGKVWADGDIPIESTVTVSPIDTTDSVVIRNISIDPTTVSGSISIPSIPSGKKQILAIMAKGVAPAISISATLTGATSISHMENKPVLPIMTKCPQDDFTERMRILEKELTDKYGSPKNYYSDIFDNSTIAKATDTFRVNNYLRTATLRYTGSYCYIYVDIADSISDATISSIASGFDAIYVKNRAVFGNEIDKGLNGESKVTLLFSSYLPSGVAGYFSPLDFYPDNLLISDYSNERKIFYIRAGMGTNDLLSTVAHEFQHMINFSQKNFEKGISEELWINEGLSVYAEEINGYGLAWGSDDLFFKIACFEYYAPLISANWLSYLSPPYVYAQYASSYLFVSYLAEQYGQASIKSILSSRLTGKANVEAATGQSFDAIFNNWCLTNYLDGISTKSKYNYSAIDMRGTYSLQSGATYTLPGISYGSISGNYEAIMGPYTCFLFVFAPTITSSLDLSIIGNLNSFGAKLIEQ